MQPNEGVIEVEKGDVSALYANVRSYNTDQLAPRLRIAPIEHIMRRLHKRNGQLHMPQRIVPGRARVANLLFKRAFFLGHLRKLLVVNLLRDGIVDKLLNKRVFASADGNKQIGEVSLGVRFQSSLFFQLFLRSVHDQIQHLVIEVNLLQFLADPLLNILFARVALRTPMRPLGLGTPVVGVTFLDFRRHLQTAFSADEKTPVGEHLVALGRFRMLRRVE